MRIWAAACAGLAAACASMAPPGLASPYVVALDGGPWVAEDIDGGGVMDYARLDAIFDAAGGTFSGLAGCNRYRGAMKQGAKLRLGPMVVGQERICGPALRDMEGKFIAALEGARVVEMDATGAVFLRGKDGRVVKLRRE
ncbi:hypothetical protein GCM10011529_25910 [Polymorphobacter glacialis]|uniref:DUF306 domain-containing protein n=1 Tax=Sandarakinorhabdus glacialis TaxID=1614636 RepID=A0A917E9W3_9SPHN|nr:META domain-containing protein [Polymorphobacter glacialis]GGE18214.1 hypothetical protein GCM10011529_25910 [Polymorphobacter glacialis]